MKKIFDSLGIHAGQTVALEGAPVYLSDFPQAVHEAALNILKKISDFSKEQGVLCEHWLLLDEIHGVSRPGARAAYLDLVQSVFPADYIVMEGDLCNDALAVLASLPNKSVDRAGGDSHLSRLKKEPKPQLTNHYGQPSCALLDAAFQLRKRNASLSVVVHPEAMLVGGNIVDFRQQQAGVLAVLETARLLHKTQPEFPCTHGVLHLWLDAAQGICAVERTCVRGTNVIRRFPKIFEL